MDSGDHYHVVYDNNGTLKYATNMSGALSTQSLDFLGGTSGASLAIDANKKAHIAYYDQSANVMYATNVSGVGWAREFVEQNIGSFDFPSVSCAISGETLNVTYYNSFESSVKHAFRMSASNWHASTIETPANLDLWSTSIALDNSALHYSYVVYYNGATSMEMYADDLGGVWHVYNLGSSSDIRWQSSIALDSNNKAHICSFKLASLGNLVYSTNASGSFSDTLIDDSSMTGNQNSIIVDHNDKVHISYWDYGKNQLKYATNKNGSW